jgi:hypothetical protein
MKEFLRNITALFLAVLVLASTMSFTINKHFCGDHLVSTSVFLKAKSCGMDNPQTSKKDCETIVKDCCKEEQQLIEGQEDLKLDLTDLNDQQQLFLHSFVLTYIDLFEGLEKHIVPYKHYRPPLVVKDIQLLDEVFLI